MLINFRQIFLQTNNMTTKGFTQPTYRLTCFYAKFLLQAILLSNILGCFQFLLSHIINAFNPSWPAAIAPSSYLAHVISRPAAGWNRFCDGLKHREINLNTGCISAITIIIIIIIINIIIIATVVDVVICRQKLS